MMDLEVSDNISTRAESNENCCSREIRIKQSIIYSDNAVALEGAMVLTLHSIAIQRM